MALLSPQVDVKTLRKVAAVRGLVNNEARRAARPGTELELIAPTPRYQTRAAAWPKLLGVDCFSVDPEAYKHLALERHRDSATVQCDVQRSLWHYTKSWDEARRSSKRASLQRVLNGVVGRHVGEVYYYQGLHDVASVLLLVCGEDATYAMLERLTLNVRR